MPGERGAVRDGMCGPAAGCKARPMMSAEHLAPPDRTRVGRTRMRMDSGQFTACGPLDILDGPLTQAWLRRGRIPQIIEV